MEVIAVANGKGGVGKTEVSANCAALWAAQGRRVLAVDLDPQGNLAVDLGVDEHDEGRMLLAAVTAGMPVVPRASVRTNLDLVTAGRSTDVLLAALGAMAQQAPGQPLEVVGTALRQAGQPYDVVVIDTPPAGGLLADCALASADWLVIPTRADDRSLLGLQRVASRVAEIREQGQQVARLLAVVMFAMPTSAKALRSETRTSLEEALEGTGGQVCQAVIRTSDRAAVDQSRTGVVAGEYRAAAEALTVPWYQDREAPRFAAGAHGLAEDYVALAAEIAGMVQAVRA